MGAGGVHLHHYLYGILILTIVSILGLVERSPRMRAWLGLAAGIGLALIVDEIALLVELKDVYWQGPGEVSVAVGVILIGIAGSVLALTRSPPPDES